MMVRVAPRALLGEIEVPGCKSAAHRALICAALAQTPTEIENLPRGADVSATIRCLGALGARWDGQTMRRVQPGATAIMTCGESASTLRMLLPVTCALGVTARFTGRGSLLRRPVEPLLVAMQAHGAQFSGRRVPLTVSGRLRTGEYVLDGDVSSQFVSGLLLAMPLMDSGSVIRMTSPLESTGYVRMTLEALDLFSISAMERENGYLVPGGQGYRSPECLQIEGDWSVAAAFLIGGALQGDVTVRGLRLPTSQPDSEIVSILRRFGAKLGLRRDTVRITGTSLTGAEVDLSPTPDLLPLLAVLGASARGVTRLTGAARTRMQEESRLQSTANMLLALGGDAQIEQGALVIHGSGRLRGGEVEPHGDHRIVMAAAIAAAVCEGDVLLSGSEAVAKSYPGFFEDLARLGGSITPIDR